MTSTLSICTAVTGLLLVSTLLVGAQLLDENRSVGEDQPPLSVSTRDFNSQKIITMEIPGTPVRRLIDPHGTWLQFMRHSERTNRRHRAKNARKTKNLNGLRGPEGPPGPPGPPGPAGAHVTKDVLLSEFRNMVRDAAERRAQALIDELCEDCDQSLLHNITGPYMPPLFEVDEAAVVPKTIWGFNCNLEEETKISRRSMSELKGFYVPFAQGGFQRGEGVEPAEGRFTVPRSGVYNFIANLQIRHRTLRNKTYAEGKNIGKILRVMICINSLCKRNVSLETVVQLIPIPWQGTVTVSGFLQLEKDQYVSIYIDNVSSEALLVLNTSNFGGTLIGL